MWLCMIHRDSFRVISREKGVVDTHVVALSHSQLPTTSSFLDHEKSFPVEQRSSPWGSSEIVEQVDDDDDDDDDDQKEGSSNNFITSTGTAAANSSAGTASLILKKRGRGGALMVGSRCSRVNGRGWRCCQPTLVGYSLCEHHLGKGRLRSITGSATVRVGAATQKNKLEKQQRPASVVVQNGSSQEEVIITKPVPMIRRRSSSSSSSSSATKLGMVKARSISRLLDETTTDQTTTNETISRSRPSVFIGRRQ